MLRTGSLLLALTLVGCAPRARDLTLNNPPADFAFALTLLEPPAPNETEPAEPVLFILEPDRWLRVATGPGVAQPRYPLATRRLSHAQFTRLWNLTLESGFTDQPPHESGSVQPVHLWLTAAGVRHELAFDQSQPPDLLPLIDELHRLAWLSEARPE